jgi:hypothetical protein
MKRKSQIYAWVFFPILLTIVSVSLTGCSWSNGRATELDQKILAGDTGADDATSVEIRPADSSEVNKSKAEITKSDYIEVIWEIPSGNVEGYIIRYGLARDQMTQEVKLNADEPQKVISSDGIERYRYLLPNIPSDKPLYLSIAAIGAGGESAPTEIFEVPSDGPQVVTPSIAPTPALGL